MIFMNKIHLNLKNHDYILIIGIHSLKRNKKGIIQFLYTKMNIKDYIY